MGLEGTSCDGLEVESKTTPFGEDTNGKIVSLNTTSLETQIFLVARLSTL